MKKIYLEIHKAIHDVTQTRIKVHGVPYDIQTNLQNLRMLVFMDEGREWEIVQQNPNTRSSYATRAREGEKISWLIPHYQGFRYSQGWKVITDSTEAID